MDSRAKAGRRPEGRRFARPQGYFRTGAHMTAGPVVGVIANPVSARDIRRIISYAGNLPVTERANIVLRLLAGLAAAGAGKVVMMPENSGICGNLIRDIDRAARQDRHCFPVLEILDMPVTGSAADSALAARMMREMEVAAIVVLGGDGTHRVVVSECGQVPIASISTGTNNAFPEMREPTVTGLAVGLAARSEIPPAVAFQSNKRLEVQINDRRQTALVDVAVVGERYVGARAVWRTGSIRELFVTFGEPGGIGLSSIAGLAAPVARDAPHGRHVCFCPPETAPFRLNAPIAPGLMETVGIASIDRLEFDQPVALAPAHGSLALDGEREVVFSLVDRVSVVLRDKAFQTVDVDACMAHAAAEGLFADRENSNVREQFVQS